MDTSQSNAFKQRGQIRYIYMLTALMYCFFEFLSVRNYVLIFITTLLPCPSFCVPDRDRDTRAEGNYETGG